MSAEWQGACAELDAALAACARRDCGISADAARLVDLVVGDESFGSASVRHVARVIRRETVGMALRARQVEAARRGREPAFLDDAQKDFHLARTFHRDSRHC